VVAESLKKRFADWEVSDWRSGWVEIYILE